MNLLLAIIALFILVCIAVFIILIPITFFHELGHFLAAKYFGFTVKEFCIGSGIPFFEKKIGDTNIVLKSALGIGGHIAVDYNLVGFKEMDDRRLLGTIYTCLAGPFVNILMAIIAFFFIKASPFILLFYIFSLSTGITNLIPSGKTDGQIAFFGIKEYLKRKKT